jgi:hypothetical protein
MDIRHAALAAICALALSGCVTAPATPVSVALSLDPCDPKFRTPACREARAGVAAYQDREGERLATRAAMRAAGFAVPGVALAPLRFGLAANDAGQRMALNRALVRGCVTNPQPEQAAYLS